MASGDVAGLPRSTTVASFGAIVLIGLLAFLIVSWNNKRTQAATLRDEIVTLDAKLEEKQKELAPLERQQQQLQRQADLFARGRMCVVNPSSDKRVTITKLSVVYLDENDEFQNFNSDVAGGVSWSIPPGTTEMLRHDRSGWDGAVTYFALLYSVPGQQQPSPLAQRWLPDPEYCVRLPI